MAEETLKNDGAAELSDEALEQVDGGFGPVVWVKEQENLEKREREMVKGRPIATFKS